MNRPWAEITGFCIQTNEAACGAVTVEAINIIVSDNDITNISGSGIEIRATGPNIVVRDCEIHNCGAWGVDARGATPSIYDNSIYENGMGGVVFNEAAGILSNNRISNNGFYGVLATGGMVEPSVLTIDDNQIRGHSTAGVSVAGGQVRILGNDIFGFLEVGNGIEVSTSGVAHIVGNTIANCGGSGIALNTPEHIGPSQVVGNNIWYNTLGISGGPGCPYGVVSSNIIIQNNVQDITYIAPT